MKPYLFVVDVLLSLNNQAINLKGKVREGFHCIGDQLLVFAAVFL